MLLIGAVMLLPLLALAGLGQGAAQDFIVHVLGRSVGTMTGRTVLWQRALELIPQHSMLGWGWQAFWAGRIPPPPRGCGPSSTSPAARASSFRIPSLRPRLNSAGSDCALLVAAMFTTLHRALRWSWRERSLVSSFHVALVLCLLICAMVEVDILYQFSIGAFVFFATMCQASDRGLRRWPYRAGRLIWRHHRVGPPHSAGVARHAAS